MIGLPFSAANASDRAKPTCRMVGGGLPARPPIELKRSELDGLCCFAWIIPHLLSEFFERHKRAPRLYMRYIASDSCGAQRTSCPEVVLRLLRRALHAHTTSPEYEANCTTLFTYRVAPAPEPLYARTAFQTSF